MNKDRKIELLKKQIANLNYRITEIQAERDSLHKQNYALKKRVDEYDEKIGNLVTKLRSQEEYNSALSSELRKVKVDYVNAHRDLIVLKDCYVHEVEMLLSNIRTNK